MERIVSWTYRSVWLLPRTLLSKTRIKCRVKVQKAIVVTEVWVVEEAGDQGVGCRQAKLLHSWRSKTLMARWRLERAKARLSEAIYWQESRLILSKTLTLQVYFRSTSISILLAKSQRVLRIWTNSYQKCSRQLLPKNNTNRQSERIPTLVLMFTRSVLSVLSSRFYQI